MKSSIVLRWCYRLFSKRSAILLTTCLIYYAAGDSAIAFDARTDHVCVWNCGSGNVRTIIIEREIEYHLGPPKIIWRLPSAEGAIQSEFGAVSDPVARRELENQSVTAYMLFNKGRRALRDNDCAKAMTYLQAARDRGPSPSELQDIDSELGKLRGSSNCAAVTQEANRQAPTRADCAQTCAASNEEIEDFSLKGKVGACSCKCKLGWERPAAGETCQRLAMKDQVASPPNRPIQDRWNANLRKCGVENLLVVPQTCGDLDHTQSDVRRAALVNRIMACDGVTGSELEKLRKDTFDFNHRVISKCFDEGPLWAQAFTRNDCARMFVDRLRANLGSANKITAMGHIQVFYSECIRGKTDQFADYCNLGVKFTMCRAAYDRSPPDHAESNFAACWKHTLNAIDDAPRGTCFTPSR